MGRLLKEMFVITIGVIAVIYLANPTAGLIELIPDNAPLIGNLDEAGALILLMNVLSYYGIDITNIWKRDNENKSGRLPLSDGNDTNN